MPIESQPDVLTWIASLAALFTAATAWAAWLVVARTKGIEKRLERLERLDEVSADLKKLGLGGEALDLRRLEHVLIDIRDGQKRFEDRTLAIVERAGRESLSGASGASALTVEGAAGLQDRIVTRLLALGYERIVLVTPPTDLALVAREGGAVVLEARRDGAACKGRVLVEGGHIQDIQIQSAYSTFP